MECRIGYVIVGVKALEPAVAFYRDVMGFDFQFSEPEMHFASFKVGDMTLLARRRGRGNPRHRRPQHRHRLRRARCRRRPCRACRQGRQVHHGAGQDAVGRLHGDVRRPGRQRVLPRPGGVSAMAIAIRCLAATYYDGFHIKPHRHHWGQLIYAGSGVMRVRAGGMLWIVPPARAVWVPVGIEHEIHGLGDFAMRTLYFPDAMVVHCRPSVARSTSPRCCASWCWSWSSCARSTRATSPPCGSPSVAIDRIAEARTLPLQLPLPSDPRALRLAEGLREDPSSQAEPGRAGARRPGPARARSSGCSWPRPACRSRSGASACACSTARPCSARASR